MCVPNKAQITHDVLSYLSEHVEAQDTFEGVVEWWLLEQKIERQTEEVKEVLDELIKKKLIVARQGKDARIHYRINRRKTSAIASLLQQKPDRLES
jgi:hypothetical protein